MRDRKAFFIFILLTAFPLKAHALAGANWSPYSSLTTLVLSSVLALVLLFAPLIALVILGFRLEKLRQILKMCMILCLTVGVLILLLNFAVPGLFKTILGLVYGAIGMFSYRMIRKRKKEATI